MGNIYYTKEIFYVRRKCKTDTDKNLFLFLVKPLFVSDLVYALKAYNSILFMISSTPKVI